jgi:hypothetical protein
VWISGKRFLRMSTPNIHHRPDELEGLTDAQEIAAENAETVGAFVEEFRERTKELVERGAVEQGEVEERENVIKAAAKGSEHLKLADLQENVLGQAMVGGGDGGVQLSRDVFATAESAEDAEQAKHVAAHEREHAKQVQLHGTLVVDGKEVDHLLILEGGAELAGNEAVGKGVGHHREGQPEKTYAEGQRAVVDIIHRVGRAKLDAVLKGSGDVTVLRDPKEKGQEALAA